ncbi:cupin domain-containing protein [Lacicoccus alkaliphilus]|uniref:Cupin domain-containing protein n=1 Tax=Lacicoccus alkaliphilus DSM 16010 TaxID=1123231 RepID=A0A1M7FZ14_9BACL|nr:cupin domain-containing protein [Salinicoccus alkaliphilus]SHM08927.1 Cupin domain-containing protein [Salinicoccus alkaliphilus DSM 16010]
MIYRTDEKMQIENLHGGSGVVTIEKCSTDGHHAFKAVVKVTVPPGATIGFHKHEEDYEGYYIMEGTGRFHENSGSSEVSAGDFCLIDEGGSHGIDNTGSGKMTIFAVVMK